MTVTIRLIVSAALSAVCCGPIAEGKSTSSCC
jgi:hypothetical protein